MPITTLPIGWVQVTGAPEGAVAEYTDSLLAPYGDRAAILFTAGPRAHNGAQALEADPSRVFDIVRELLRERLFSIIAIETFDAIHPPIVNCPNFRAWWIGRQVGGLRSLLHQAQATLVPVCVYPRSGGHVFQAAIDLRLTVRRNGQGVVVLRSGRAA
jgi:hypothetical protein